VHIFQQIDLGGCVKICGTKEIVRYNSALGAHNFWL